MFATLEALILNLIHTLPLGAFVVVGSFIEEIIPPIPSPSIMILAGSFAVVQNYSFGGLAFLVLLASLGKTTGALVLYSVTKYAQDYLVGTFGHVFNITQGDIERFGKRFRGGFRDYASLAILRSIPIIPSVILSFGSGVIKLPIRVFLVGTFIGTIVRDTLYLFVGVSGTSTLEAFVHKPATVETYLTLGALMFCAGLFVYFIFKRLKK
jgi:membrane protein DedA with SNARE-associated domain